MWRDRIKEAEFVEFAAHESIFLFFAFSKLSTGNHTVVVVVVVSSSSSSSWDDHLIVVFEDALQELAGGDVDPRFVEHQSRSDPSRCRSL